MIHFILSTRWKPVVLIASLCFMFRVSTGVIVHADQVPVPQQTAPVVLTGDAGSASPNAEQADTQISSDEKSQSADSAGKSEKQIISSRTNQTNESFNQAEDTDTSSVSSSSKPTNSTEEAQPTKQAYVGYATITRGDGIIHQKPESSSDQQSTTSQILHQTYRVDGILIYQDGKSFYQLVKSDGTLLGYVSMDMVTLSKSPLGVATSTVKYVQAQVNGRGWRSSDLSQSGSEYNRGQFFQVTGTYHHADGILYYAINDLHNHFFAYVKANEFKDVIHPEGAKSVKRKYVRVKSPKRQFWSNFNWNQVLNQTDDYLGQAVEVTATYHHLNGAVYYSLWSNSEEWLGYANTGFFMDILKPQGKYKSVNRYVTVSKSGDQVWSTFTWTKKSTTSHYYNQKVIAKYEFHHVNGGTYYSLYDFQNHWLGYVKASSVALIRKPQGNARSGTKYVRITKRGGTIWGSFNWSKRYSTSSLLNKVYFAGCWYHHLNGGFYYSLYDFNNKWIGYLNTGYTAVISKPQGKTTVIYWPVRITRKNFPIWSSFLWKEKSNTSKYYRKIVTARYAFHHVNGSNYYSLYSGNTWLGYVNTTFTDAPSPFYTKLKVPYYNQFHYGAPVGCEGVSLIMAMHYKGMATRYSVRKFLSTIPKSSTPYRGFVGSPFVSNAFQYTAIFASPLAAWGRKYGNAVNATGSSVTRLLAEVAKGNPVVVYVTVHFASPQWANWPFGRVPNNNHAVVLAGFDQNKQRIYVSDPIDGQYWLSLSKFTAIYNTRKMAVVVRA